jgi:hypothetical protein
MKKRKRVIKIKTQQLLPLLLIVINLLAAAVYFAHKDIKKGVYWLAAAVLNITVTF